MNMRKSLLKTVSVLMILLFVFSLIPIADRIQSKSEFVSGDTSANTLSEVSPPDYQWLRVYNGLPSSDNHLIDVIQAERVVGSYG